MGYFSNAIIDNNEADRDDWAGYMADIDFNEESEEYNIAIRANRIAREKLLKGKYVIICDGPKGGIRFLQDQLISPSFKGHYWTDYKSNAKGFVDLSAALVRCKNLRHNNPRVMYVHHISGRLISWRNM